MLNKDLEKRQKLVKAYNVKKRQPEDSAAAFFHTIMRYQMMIIRNQMMVIRNQMMVIRNQMMVIQMPSP